MRRGYRSKHGDSGQSGDLWYCTAERLVAEAPPPHSPPPSQFPKEEEITSAIKFVAVHNGDGGGGSVEGRES